MTKPNLSLDQPFVLDPTNFTRLERTPWAGTKLAQGIKHEFAPSADAPIGESWEFSCAPEALSRIDGSANQTIVSLIRRSPSEALSPELTACGRAECDILVKLLNAASPLSLQIHPRDGHPALKDDESGKPETWLVLEADAGAGIYLGFSHAMSRERLEHQLTTGEFDASSLHFVPVKKGDFFEIEPAVPHAVGPGIVLLEPQYISPGRNGKTWRMWDWNRRYDENGELDAKNGKARELHINESMSLVSPETQVGDDFVAKLRRRPKTFTKPGSAVSMYPANEYFQVLHTSMARGSSLRLLPGCHYGILTLIAGKANLRAESSGKIQAIEKGQTAFLPFASLPLCIENVTAEAEWALVVPAIPGQEPQLFEF